MPGRKLYIFNSETLSYEVARTSWKARLTKWAVIFLTASACFLFYSFIYVKVLGFKPPKTVILERRNSELVSTMELMDQRMDEDGGALLDIQMRDNSVYRQIFGMDRLQTPSRGADIASDLRYVTDEECVHSSMLAASGLKLDMLLRKAAAQATSLEEVSLLSQRAGEMASCVPNFNPVDMTTGRIGVSSPFGYRFHPVYHQNHLHSGIDLNGPVGEPVYATGDGVVEAVEINFYGYGNCIVINHGFGYKTRYAHLRTIHAFEGQKVRRGDQIATLGNSGRTTGAHLHYEVIYMGNFVNPWNYMNDDLTGEEYRSMVRLSAGAGR